MLKARLLAAAVTGAVLLVAGGVWAEDRELAGVTFPEEKEVNGHTLKLNGLALRKAMVVVKVFAGGFYLEQPTQDAETAIESEQVKHFYLHYLTSKATAKKLRDGFVEAITAANPPELVAAHQAEIDQYAQWLDTDMKPGGISESIYEPGIGLTLMINGEKKGTIAGPEFAKLYMRYNLGEKADAQLRKGYLGL
jgi:hypothetical protein